MPPKPLRAGEGSLCPYKPEGHGHQDCPAPCVSSLRPPDRSRGHALPHPPPRCAARPQRRGAMRRGSGGRPDPAQTSQGLPGWGRLVPGPPPAGPGPLHSCGFCGGCGSVSRGMNTCVPNTHPTFLNGCVFLSQEQLHCTAGIPGSSKTNSANGRAGRPVGDTATQRGTGLRSEAAGPRQGG